MLRPYIETRSVLFFPNSSIINLSLVKKQYRKTNKYSANFTDQAHLALCLQLPGNMPSFSVTLTLILCWTHHVWKGFKAWRPWDGLSRWNKHLVEQTYQWDIYALGDITKGYLPELSVLTSTLNSAIAKCALYWTLMYHMNWVTLGLFPPVFLFRIPYALWTVNNYRTNGIVKTMKSKWKWQMWDLRWNPVCH